MTDIRIEYSIQKQGPEDADFIEVGFGSSGSWDDIDAALYAISSDIQQRSWETVPGMPAPEEVDQP